MELNYLKIYKEIIDAQSLNKAADNLFMSHQALSYILKKLENEFAAKLVERTNKGIFPTKNGQLLYEATSGIIDEINRAQNEIKRKNCSFNLKIYIDTLTYTKILPNFLDNIVKTDACVQAEHIIWNNLKYDSKNLTKKDNAELEMLLNDENSIAMLTFSGEKHELVLDNLEIMHLKESQIFLGHKTNWHIKNLKENGIVFVIDERAFGRDNVIIDKIKNFGCTIYFVRSQIQCETHAKKGSAVTVEVQDAIERNTPLQYEPFAPRMCLQTFAVYKADSLADKLLFHNGSKKLL